MKKIENRGSSSFENSESSKMENCELSNMESCESSKIEVCGVVVDLIELWMSCFSLLPLLNVMNFKYLLTASCLLLLLVSKDYIENNVTINPNGYRHKAF